MNAEDIGGISGKLQEISCSNLAKVRVGRSIRLARSKFLNNINSIADGRRKAAFLLWRERSASSRHFAAAAVSIVLALAACLTDLAAAWTVRMVFN